MGYIESKVIPTFKHRLIYLKYVDDCSVLVKSDKIFDEFFSVSNNAHKSINFTMEKEPYNELAFFRCTELDFKQLCREIKP